MHSSKTIISSMASFFLLHFLLFATTLLTLVLSDIITQLPGFSGPLPFHLETGYVNVDEVNDVELFYYFISSERNPAEDPLILWLTGGPGCSAFSGLVFEIGPLKFARAEYIEGSIPSLIYNHYSWTKIANIIFLDSPVGTGFSYAENPKGYEVDDKIWANHVKKFLRKWLAENLQFIPNDLYIAGDSYGGKIVPIAAHYIVQDIEVGIQPLLNLKGYLIGNPVTGESIDTSSRVPFAHGQGLISDELYQVLQANCTSEDFQNHDSRNQQCANALRTFEMFMNEINRVYIVEPLCPGYPQRKISEVGRGSLGGNYLSNIMLETEAPDIKCRAYLYYLSYIWANDNVARHALKIREGTKDLWLRCNYSIPYPFNAESSIKYQLNLTKKGYRALVYSGDKDMTMPFIGTQKWIRSLNYSIVKDWRSWHVKGQVAGYTRSYSNNLTFATVKDAGHTAPEYRPENCLVMIDRWISHKPL